MIHFKLNQVFNDSFITIGRELNEVGVTGTKGEAGYYFMPDFGPLRTKLNARGIFTGRQMIAAMLAEPKVAVSRYVMYKISNFKINIPVFQN